MKFIPAQMMMISHRCIKQQVKVMYNVLKPWSKLEPELMVMTEEDISQ